MSGVECKKCGYIPQMTAAEAESLGVEGWSDTHWTGNVRCVERQRDRLQAIVDKLDMTADKVPVTPGMVLYRVRAKNRCGCVVIDKLDRGDTIEIHGKARRFAHIDGWLVNISECYSTLTAAEAARDNID